MKKLTTKIILALSLITITANANEWRDAEISKAGEKMWKKIGYTKFSEAKKWGTGEYDFYKAKKWALNGFKSYDESIKWIELGVNSPAIAKMFKKSGYSVAKIQNECGNKLIDVHKFLTSNIYSFENKCFMGGFKISSVEERKVSNKRKIEAFAYNIIIKYGDEYKGNRAVWITARNKELVQDFVRANSIYGLYKVTPKTKKVNLVNGSSLKINILDRIIAVK